MINIVHPEPVDKRLWNGKSKEDRQHWIDSFFIGYPEVNRILKSFSERMEHCERSKKFQAMLIIGGTGAGKTTLAKLMKSVAMRRYSRQDDEKTICPVVQFAIPDPCTPYEISVAILRALGESNPRARKSRADTIKAAELMLKQCEVKLVIIDNLQDIPARRGKRGIELVGARLRNLIDSSEALWVLLGTADALRVVNSDTQLIRRIAWRGQLNYFSVQGELNIATFTKLLLQIDRWLPLAEPSCLQDPSTVRAMYIASEGIFDRIIQLVDRAWFETVKMGRENMISVDLAKAFTYVYGHVASSGNPFDQSFVVRRLRGENEPFELLRGPETEKC
jgi:energy-coupling factor transporter ATP-binding protein EcfA2